MLPFLLLLLVVGCSIKGVKFPKLAVFVLIGVIGCLFPLPVFLVNYRKKSYSQEFSLFKFSIRPLKFFRLREAVFLSLVVPFFYLFQSVKNFPFSIMQFTTF